MFHDYKFMNQPGTSDYNHIEKVWKKFWKIGIQPKIKTFIWRLLHNVIPVRDSLQKRCISCPLFCPNYLIKEESINHLFIECEKTKKIWFGYKFTLNFQNKKAEKRKSKRKGEHLIEQDNEVHANKRKIYVHPNISREGNRVINRENQLHISISDTKFNHY